MRGELEREVEYFLCLSVLKELRFTILIPPQAPVLHLMPLGNAHYRVGELKGKLLDALLLFGRSVECDSTECLLRHVEPILEPPHIPQLTHRSR